MHATLTRAEHSRFSGTSVPRDFVEAPSQMLEAWVWDKAVLDRFAADYRDPDKKIPAETLDQLEEALEAGVDAVLLDNMSVPELEKAVAMVAGAAVTEASGGITPETVPAVAATGVDLISVGYLTHSAPSLDVGLDFVS